MRATVVNCTSDHNKGASAISWGLVQRLVTSPSVDAVTLVSKTAAAGHPEFRHTVERFAGDVPLLASPMPGRREHAFRNAASLLGPAVGLRSADYRRGLVLRDPAAHAIATSDVVFNRGGPFFSVPKGRFHIGVRLSWPLLFAEAEGIPYALVGEGVGPFANRWAERFHRRVFEGAALVRVRDELSRRRLVSIGVPEDRIELTLDNAFWIEPDASARVQRVMQTNGLADEGFIAVTVRRWPGADAYLPELAKTIDDLVPSFVDRAVLVSNTYTPGKPEADDRNLTRDLGELLAHNPGVVVLDEDLTPEELASLYGRAAVTLGTRLHSVILALVGGRPAVAVSYLPKTEGVMSLLGLGEYVLDMHGFRHERAAELVRQAAVQQGHVPALIDRRREEDSAGLEAFLAGLAPRNAPPH